MKGLNKKKIVWIMIFIYVLNLIYCEKVSVLYGEDPNLYLSIVKGKSGGKTVRLISKDKKVNLETIDIFDTTSTSSPTKLLTKSDGYICGKPKDPGVVTCIDQRKKSSFTFEKDGEYVRVKADNGQCLTKTGLDTSTGGFYLNLKNCNGKSEQKFLVKRVETYERVRKPVIYNLESLIHRKLTNSYDYHDEIESHDSLRGGCEECRENEHFLQMINQIESLASRLKHHMKKACLSAE